ncbi:phage portal protein [Tsukamurella spumae]|uniref:Phage portal protein n=1 Tax=Tsukamurella spumae TaxID=44753 RepID=A0A846X7H8_9ACTN|nr:phage portal protein [Tsukamurella spumae]NKY21011.1 phage portal protein [Tsukamurella spumae]
MTDTLTALLQAVDAPAGKYSRLNRYYAGTSPLSYLAPEAQAVLGDRLRRVSSNIPRVLVNSLVERLRITGFTGADVWVDWLRNDLDQRTDTAHREAMILGAGYVIVWADQDGRPQVSIESAQQMAQITDPGTRQTIAALKRWETAATTEATLFLPDRIERYRANSTGATTAGFKLVDELDNPLGVVPVVRLLNADRILDLEGRSEMEDIIDLSDALTKLLTDLLVASETSARPRRWATGVELTEDEDGNPVSPFAETTKMLIAEQPEAQFGQLSGTDLAGYRTGIDTIMRQIAAVSGLPEHALGIGGDNPTSADAIRASEAALTARAETKQALFGRDWEQVARLMVAVRDGADVRSVDVRVQWADASTRSTAQEADAVTKLYQAGILPASYALKRLGYSDAEIDEIHAARTRDAVANVNVAQLFGGAA